MAEDAATRGRVDTELLAEMRDLLRELRDLAVALRAAPIRGEMRSPYAPARGKLNLMPQPLMAHRDKIAAWKRLGMSGVQITQMLKDEGVKTSKSAVSRFLRGYLMPDPGQ